jgi:ABC-type multidrug transport system fused ATPase/permease subunit
MAASGVSGIQLGLVARKRFEDVFALPAEEGTYSPDVATAAPRSASVQKRAVASAEVPAVRFEDVVFGYEAERPVLRGARFTVPGRGLTAVVGLSGSGKTTVLSLIERFMEPDSGRIEVHGRDLSDWSPADLRSRIAYVDQASTLLQESVRANLVLGRRRPADDTTLYSVLDRVGLAEDIRALPDGLDTVLDGATGLSGGQRQRLALARAVLADADLVLLDEPTSHLDSVNEQRLRLAVDRLAAERAVVVVAHRISTIQHADHVIVMDRGAVTDEGGHAALVDRCPAYAELVAGQSLGADFRAPVAA